MEIDTWSVFIVRCADGTLYTGISNDVGRRVDLHNQGKGAHYTRGRLPVTLIYQEAVGARAQATRREAAIKRMSRAAKLALVLRSSEPRQRVRYSPTRTRSQGSASGCTVNTR